jgi:hypothetical protein
MNFIDNIKKQNKFPILFIGSGITQRYFENAPNWLQLLEQIWNIAYDNDGDKKFYDYCNELRLQEADEFEIYMQLAKKLEKDVDALFSRGKLTIEGLTNEKSFKDRVSPFRYLIAQIFSNLKQRDGVDEEIAAFAKMLQKARFVITTNYDTFIEDCYPQLSIKVGNAGLFEKSSSYGELYKIHGSTKNSNSITITKADYDKNESKLALVNAKILSHLIESPVLFLGYSLTDENIKQLLKTFAENVPSGKIDSTRQIGVVDWVKDKSDITDTLILNEDKTFMYTSIQTDNFWEIYHQLSEIEQGLTPSDIAKYEHAIRNIIEERGKSGNLKNVLAHFGDLEQLPHEKNIVVAIGDGRYIHKFPEFEDYIRDYFSNKREIPLEIALQFLRRQSRKTHLPINHYFEMLEVMEGIPNSLEKEINSLKLRKRSQDSTLISRFSNLQISKEAIQKLKTLTDVLVIYNRTDVDERNRMNYILKNIRTYSLGNIKDLIDAILESRSDDTIRKTEYRKLFTAFDVLSRE